MCELARRCCCCCRSHFLSLSHRQRACIQLCVYDENQIWCIFLVRRRRSSQCFGLLLSYFVCTVCCCACCCCLFSSFRFIYLCINDLKLVKGARIPGFDVDCYFTDVELAKTVSHLKCAKRLRFKTFLTRTATQNIILFRSVQRFFFQIHFGCSSRMEHKFGFYCNNLKWNFFSIIFFLFWIGIRNKFYFGILFGSFVLWT